MKKVIWIISVIVLLPIIIFAGVLGFLKFADLNNYKSDIENLVRKYADMEIKINGDIDVGVSLKPSLELSDVDISDNQNNKLAHIGNALVQISVLPLLHKEVVVEKVQTDNTEIFYNEKDSMVINDLDLGADSYDSPINVAFDTTVAGIDIFGTAEIDSFKKLKENNYNDSDIKTNIRAMGYDLQYVGTVNNMQDKIKTSGKYEIVYKKTNVFGNLDFSMENELPYVKMDVNSQKVNVKDFTEKKQVSNSWLISSAYAEEYIPNTEIPYDYLRMVNADITLDVKQIKVDENIILNDVKGDISLKDGVLKSNIQNVKFKNNVLNGKVDITSPKNLPYIKLNIKGDGFDINDFTTQKKSDKRAEVNFDWLIGSAQATELMNNYKIPYKYLKMANADVNINIKKINKGDEFVLSDIAADANLKNGVLKSNINNIAAGGGKINGSILLNGSNKTLAVYLKGTNIIAQNFYKPYSQPNNKQIYIKKGGKTTFNIDINTSGVSTDDYFANASGQIIVFADESVINIKSLSKLQGNIIAQILDILKLKTSDGDMSLSCAVVRGDIKQGVVNFPKGIAFNADNFYLVADGKINFNNDKINLDLQPFSGKITDVNISSILGNLIKITGTLNKPTIGINQTSTAKNVIGAIASGGVYNVGDLMLSADGAPCHTALKGTSYAEYFKGDNSIGGSVSSGYNNTKDTIKDLGKDIKSQAKDLKKQLKGLFK